MVVESRWVAAAVVRCDWWLLLGGNITGNMNSGTCRPGNPHPAWLLSGGGDVTIAITRIFSRGCSTILARILHEDAAEMTTLSQAPRGRA